MPSAKDIRVAPISRQDADAVVKRIHYSHKVVRNSQLHLGVFINGRLEGAMQFGPSLDKSHIVHLVRDTAWNGFIELNRMAFSDALPRNSESRALGVAMRMLRKNYPHLEWVISFADGCQCGDGTIYRAAGFVLSKIKKNKDLILTPEGQITHKLSQLTGTNRLQHMARTGGRWSPEGEALPGFMLRYIYFLNPAAKERMVEPPVPFSALDEAGARMYKGKSVSREK